MKGERLRIAIFSDSAFPILNGVSVSVNSLIGELRNQGHSVHLFTAAYPHYKDPDANSHRFWALQTPWAKGYPLAMPPFYRMLQRFRKHEFDIVHTHTPFTVGFVGLRWAESHDLPIVSTYHTLYDRYAHYIPYLPRRYTRFRIAKHTNFYYNAVDHVITPSEASQKWLLRHSVVKPVTVIPTGVPRGPIIDRTEARLALGIPSDQKILLYVGRLAKEKNLEVLFDAVAQVFAQDPTARLWLVGDGPYREESTAIVRALNMGDRVRFVGFVPRVEVDRYYAAADLFVFSSITETQGLVVIEAMTYGLPAVAVAGGGASEAIEDDLNGFVVKNDSESLAEAVFQVTSDERLYGRLSAGALATARKYSPESMVSEVLAVYHQVLIARGESARRPTLV